MDRMIIFFMFVIVSCTLHDPASPSSIAPAPYDGAIALIHESSSILREGDLVVRDGQEFSSQLIKQFNRRDQTYSHSGLVFLDKGIPVVYHIVPGEEPDDDSMKKDSLEKFCNPRKNAGYAIYRYDLSDSERKLLKSYVVKLYQQKVSFDSAFDYQTDKKMYCSEMIRKGLDKATHGRILLDVTRPSLKEAAFFSHHLKIPATVLSKQDIISIDNLYINQHCQLVRKFEFNNRP